MALQFKVLEIKEAPPVEKQVNDILREVCAMLRGTRWERLLGPIERGLYSLEERAQQSETRGDLLAQLEGLRWDLAEMQREVDAADDHVADLNDQLEELRDERSYMAQKAWEKLQPRLAKLRGMARNGQLSSRPVLTEELGALEYHIELELKKLRGRSSCDT